MLSKKLGIFTKRSTLWRITWEVSVFVSYRCERKGEAKVVVSLSVFRVSLHFSFTMSYKFSTTKLRIAINRLFPYPSAFNFLLPFTRSRE